MKIACFADVHAHNYKEFDKKSDMTGSQRLDNVIGTLRYIRRYCNENKIDNILFAGDMFHIRGKVNTIVYNAVYDEMKQFSKEGFEMVVIPGNHDQHDNSDVPPHSLYAFNDLPGIHVYGDLGIHTIHGDNDELINVYCVPYSKNAKRIKDWLSEQEDFIPQGVEEGKYSRICLFHLGIDGGFVGKGSYPMSDAFKVEDLRPDFFKYILMGHFHKRQFLDNHPHMFYCGAPIQHSFGDEGEDKGFYVIDTKKRYDVQFVPVPNPKFVTLTADEPTIDIMRHRDEGNYIRFEVEESRLQELINRLPQGLQYKIHLKREYREENRVDVKIGMSFEEIVSKYADEYNPDAKEVGLQILREVQEG